MIRCYDCTRSLLLPWNDWAKAVELWKQATVCSFQTNLEVVWFLHIHVGNSPQRSFNNQQETATWLHPMPNRHFLLLPSLCTTSLHGNEINNAVPDQTHPTATALPLSPLFSSGGVVCTVCSVFILRHYMVIWAHAGAGEYCVGRVTKFALGPLCIRLRQRMTHQYYSLALGMAFF
jgi:hypothetical protein